MQQSTTHQHIVFCDFDGTITQTDGFLEVCTHFAPEMVKGLFQRIQDGEITLRESIHRIVESIPSARFQEALEIAEKSAIRPGFEAFLGFLSQHNIPIVVISGGLAALVEARLEEVEGQLHAIHSAGISLKNRFVKIQSEFENDRELVDKNQVMKRYAYDRCIAIGDGMTDFRMAMDADLVFARQHLADYLNDKSIPFYPWNDFYDIIKVMKEKEIGEQKK